MVGKWLGGYTRLQASNLTLETGAFRVSLPAGGGESAQFYQGTADATGVAALYPDGSVTNVRKVDAQPTVTIEPHETWRPAEDHGLGDQFRQG